MLVIFLSMLVYIAALYYISKDINNNHHLYPYQKTMWMLLIIFMPFMGAFFYYLLGVRRN